MISSGLEGTGLESRVAGWAATAAIDDAAAVRAVIEAYGDRLAAADVAGVVSQFTGSAAAMQPGLETAVGSQQLTATYEPLWRTCAWTLRSDPTTSPSKATSRPSAPPATGRSRSAPPARRNQRVSGNCSFWNAQGPAGRSRSTYTSGCRSSFEGAAPASSESATRIGHFPSSASRRPARRGAGHYVDLPARTGAVQVDGGVTGAVGVPPFQGGRRCWRSRSGRAGTKTIPRPAAGRAASWPEPAGAARHRIPVDINNRSNIRINY